MKNDYFKTTPKKKKISNDYIEENYRTKIKNKKFEINERNKKIENDDDGLVTSFERKPSELKSPDTISEDSFTSSYEEEKSENEEEKSHKNTQNIKEKTNNYNNDKRDNNTYSELEENELIYIERINYGKDEEKGEHTTTENDKNSKKLSDMQDNNNNNNNTKDNSSIEKELKQREREKKKEKYRNIEIKAKMTTRQTTYAKNNNIKESNKNKIIVNKNPSELIMNTERESANSKINNIIKINLNNNGENSTYIPVNQRKKLLVNKILLDSKLKNFTKTNSLNFFETELESNEKNNKLFLTNTKNNEKNFYAITHTDERNRYKKKHINKNYSKDNDYNTNVTKLNLENLRFRASISNRKQNPNTNFENLTPNSLSQTLEISKEYAPKKRYIKDKRIELSKEKINKKNEKDSHLILKKNSVLITKTTNNKLRMNAQDSNKIKYVNNKSKPQSTNRIQKDIVSQPSIYEPKKLGVIRLRSAEKTGNSINYNNMSYDPNQFLNNKIKDVLSAANSRNINNISKNENNSNSKKNIYIGNTILNHYPIS